MGAVYIGKSSVEEMARLLGMEYPTNPEQTKEAERLAGAVLAERSEALTPLNSGQNLEEKIDAVLNLLRSISSDLGNPSHTSSEDSEQEERPALFSLEGTDTETKRPNRRSSKQTDDPHLGGVFPTEERAKFEF